MRLRYRAVVHGEIKTRHGRGGVDTEPYRDPYGLGDGGGDDVRCGYCGVGLDGVGDDHRECYRLNQSWLEGIGVSRYCSRGCQLKDRRATERARRQHRHSTTDRPSRIEADQKDLVQTDTEPYTDPYTDPYEATVMECHMAGYRGIMEDEVNQLNTDPYTDPYLTLALGMRSMALESLLDTGSLGSLGATTEVLSRPSMLGHVACL